MKIPTIHLNGTAQADLLAEYEAAIRALTAAIRLTQDITVHARDYYVQSDPDAATSARTEHAARLASLLIVRDDLQHIYNEIYKQGKK